MKKKLEVTLNDIRKAIGRTVVVHIGIRDEGEFDIIGIEPTLGESPTISKENHTTPEIKINKSVEQKPIYIG